MDGRAHTAPYTFAAATASVLLMAGLLAFFVASQHPPAYDPTSATHIFDVPGGVNLGLFGWSHGVPQRMAHRAVVAGLLLVLGLLALLGPRRTDTLVDRAERRCAPAAIGALVAVSIALAVSGLPTGFEHTGVEPRRGLELGLGVLVTFALVAAGRRHRSPPWRTASLALLPCVFLALLAPLSWFGADLARHPWSDVSEGWQYHYEVVLVGATDRLAAGERIGPDLVPWYGLVAPLTLAGVQRQFGTWTLGDYVRFAELSQVALLVLLVPSLAAYTRRRWFLVLAAIVFLGLYYHASPFLLRCLNLMGWRFLGFPVAFLGYVASHRLAPPREALLLGGVSGFCVLNNPETGVAATAGLAACFVLRRTGAASRERPRWLADGLLFLAGAALAAVGFALAYRSIVGVSPSLSALAPLLELIQLFASGLASIDPAFEPLAVVILGHATAELIASWMQRRRPLSLRRGMRVLAATCVVVWFAYYANYPIAAYLSSVLVPYAFLLIDTLQVLMGGVRGRRGFGRWKVGLAAGALALAVVPHAVRTARLEWPSYANGIERAWSGRPAGSRLVQGVWLRRDARTLLILSRAAHLRTHPAGEPLVYFSFDNLLVAKEAGVWPEVPLPVANPYGGSLTIEHYRKLLEATRRPEVKRIYFDAWAGLSPEQMESSEEIRSFHQMLRSDLSSDFAQHRVVSGWQEWLRR